MADGLSFINRALGLDKIFTGGRNPISPLLFQRQAAEGQIKRPGELREFAQPIEAQQVEQAQQTVPEQAVQPAQPAQQLQAPVAATGAAQAAGAPIPGILPEPRGRRVRRRLQRARLRGQRLKAIRVTANTGAEEDTSRRNLLGRASSDNRRRLR